MDFLRSKTRLACFRLGLWLLGKSMIAFEKSIGGRRLNDLRRVTIIELDGKEYAFEGRLYIPVKPTGGDELLAASLWPDDQPPAAAQEIPPQKHLEQGAAIQSKAKQEVLLPPDTQPQHKGDCRCERWDQ